MWGRGRSTILIGDGTIIDNVLDWESGTLNLQHPLHCGWLPVVRVCGQLSKKQVILTWHAELKQLPL